MWPLIDKIMVVIKQRAQLDQEFSQLLESHKFLASQSRYIRLQEQFDNIKFDDKLQHKITEDIYNYHAYLLWPLFPNLPELAIQDMALIGRIYADYLLIIDDFIDEDHRTLQTTTAIAQLKADFLHYRSLGLLYNYFPLNSPFWLEFETHKRAFAQAVLLEKSLNTKMFDHQTYDFSLFKEIASGKSAMTKCTPAALASLAGEPEKLNSLYRLFDNLAIVAQTYDDLKDWQVDISQRRVSYLLSKFFSEYNHDNIYEEYNKNQKKIKRQFYRSNALTQVLEEAIERLKHLTSEPELARCIYFLRILQKYQDWFCYVQQQISLARKRIEVFETPRPKKQDSLSRGLRFLLASQNSDGFWADFLTTAGESTDWITAVVAQAIEKLVPNHTCLNEAFTWLTEQQFPTGGWGYHRHVVQDADSTAASLLFLTRHMPVSQTNKSVQALLSFKNKSGGFSTYSDSTDISRVMNLEESDNFSGWCSSQNDVTAAAVLALCACFTQAAYPNAISSAVMYLLSTQREDGAWDSYWWHGDIYATALTLRAIKMATDRNAINACVKVATARQRGFDFLVNTQHKTGGWAAYAEEQECSFQTSLALRSLLTADKQYVTSVSSAIEYLLSSQRVNGSWWATSPIMRLPKPYDMEPWTWSRKASLGTTLGRVAIDQNRLFTTSSVILALSEAKEMNYEHKHFLDFTLK
ncbi:MAG: hypothetical protein ACPGWR_03650 [Ardenticatenaceae bacterium]